MTKTIIFLVLITIQALSFGQIKKTPPIKPKPIIPFEKIDTKNYVLEVLKKEKPLSFIWNINDDEKLTTETVLSETVNIEYGYLGDYSRNNASISINYCDSIYLNKFQENKKTIAKAIKEGNKNYSLYSMRYIVMLKDYQETTVNKDLIILENKDKGYKETFKAILNKQKSEIIQIQNVKSKKIYNLVDYNGSLKDTGN